MRPVVQTPRHRIIKLAWVPQTQQAAPQQLVRLSQMRAVCHPGSMFYHSTNALTELLAKKVHLELSSVSHNLQAEHAKPQLYWFCYNCRARLPAF